MRLLFVFVLVLAIIAVLYATNPVRCAGPYLSFTLDDGYIDHYSAGFPIFKKYNMTATAYIPSQLVGTIFENNTLMGWDQIKELKSAGWEIGSHSTKHKDLSELNSTDIDLEMASSKEDFRKNGIIAETLAVPYGRYNSLIKEASKKYFIGTRPSEWGYNNLQSMDKYSLKSFWATNRTSLKEMIGWMSSGNRLDLWTIIMIHFVRQNISDEYTITPQYLNSLLSYIKSTNLKVKTVSDVIKLCK